MNPLRRSRPPGARPDGPSRLTIAVLLLALAVVTLIAERIEDGAIEKSGSIPSLSGPNMLAPEASDLSPTQQP